MQILIACAAIIFYIIVILILGPMIFAPYWNWASNIGLTSYPNLDGCLVSIGLLIILVLLIVFLVKTGLIVVIGKIIAAFWQILIFLLTLGIVIYLVYSFYQWLINR